MPIGTKSLTFSPRGLERPTTKSERLNETLRLLVLKPKYRVSHPQTEGCSVFGVEVCHLSVLTLEGESSLLFRVAYSRYSRYARMMVKRMHIATSAPVRALTFEESVPREEADPDCLSTIVLWIYLTSVL